MLSQILLLFLLFRIGVSQDLSIFGNIVDFKFPYDETAKVLASSTCFQGLGFGGCHVQLPTDDLLLQETLPYQIKMNKSPGANYCLQCCSLYPTPIDIWNLTCTVDALSRTSSNVYGYNFQFGVKKTQYDFENVVKCPLKRKACDYDPVTQKTLKCRLPDAEGYHLHGYILTLHVVEHSLGTAYWRGVTSCSAETIESTIPLNIGDPFQEVIIMKHPAVGFGTIDSFKLGFLAFLAFFICYITLYFLRRRHCAVCQKKLVCCLRICYICQFVGASPPDPFLMRALEEKGVQIQGEIPEHIPGLNFIASFLPCFWTSKVVPDLKNPNRLQVPASLIFAAVGHNSPPPPPSSPNASLTRRPQSPQDDEGARSSVGVGRDFHSRR